MPSWAGQVAIVTGASSGIGWHLAKVLAAEGAKVGLTARRKDQLDALAAEIRAAGGTAEVAEANARDREQTTKALRELTAALGPVDLLVANAGVGVPMKQLDPLNVADVERTFQVNVFGIVYALEVVLPEMLKRGKGHIAAISSMAAYKGLPGESAYCASKAAVNSFMEGLRIQVRDRGIAVTTICPGFVRTPMTAPNEFKMPWLVEADDAARRIERALRRRAKVYNFPWQMSLLMGVTRWLPDWVMAREMRKFDMKGSAPEPG